MDADDILLRPLVFRSSLGEVKNRVFRSSIAGRFDNYDGSGTHARLNWEEKFAKGGVGAIISSYVPVHPRGRILPNYAMIDNDATILFWKEVAKRVHAHGCKFILQLSQSGRQQDIGGVENLFKKAMSSTSKPDFFHGILCRAMTRAEIKQVVQWFGDGARRARDAGLDGVETHSANGYLITQFLSSAINDRKDEYGGPVENRARFLLEIVDCIQREAGKDFHLQCKINGEDHNNALYPWRSKGNTLDDAVKICRMLKEKGVHAIHVSSGSLFPHPRNPAGDFPLRSAQRWYETMLSSGVRARFNFWIFNHRLLGPFFRWWWTHRRPARVEGVNIEYAAKIRAALNPEKDGRPGDGPPETPVICTGGFQTGSYIRQVLREGKTDAVSIARPLIANNDLVERYFRRGVEVPENKRCTYCNKCMLNDLANPLGCYELSRYGGDYDEMMRTVMSVFHPTAFEHGAVRCTN
jgi:2,4-dienoyl-CoA reductase-like NADH-dependent reductase (Old Yellow Enzyme family)